MRPGAYKPRAEWAKLLDDREKILAKKHLISQEIWSKGTRDLSELSIGSDVLVQNQTGPRAKKWDSLGTVVSYEGFRTYLVKMDGSGRVTKCRRHFLREVVPYSTL